MAIIILESNCEDFSMKLENLNGTLFYNAFFAGGQAIIKNKDYLNKINVFPVADADTGSNLAFTLQSIMESASSFSSIKDTITDMADKALTYARGNSGIIFSQYLYGLSKELINKSEVNISEFAQSAKNAVKYLYESIAEPIEGTMLTVIKDWADSLIKHSSRSNDFFVVLKLSLNDAILSLNNTPKLLKILSENKVIDAGAQGFVNFLEGILEFILNGCQTKTLTLKPIETLNVDIHDDHIPEYRFCCEALLTDINTNLDKIKKSLSEQGHSLIMAGDKDKIHLHIHHNQPVLLYQELFSYGTLSKIKVDDMLMQYNISQNRRYDTGIIIDSACDIPEELINEFQIMKISYGISFDEQFFIDGLTINSDIFYKKLKHEKIHPLSSQPSPGDIDKAYSFMSNKFKNIISIHISKNLSGIFNNAESVSKKYSNILSIDSKNLSVSYGLLVYRITDAIKKNTDFIELQNMISQWTAKSMILTDVNTLKYMVRGGRVSPLKGLLAKILNLKPIISVDKEGKAMAYGKSFSRSANMKKIISIINKIHSGEGIWNYAIVHADCEERANKYAQELFNITGKKPLYVMPLSPVVGVHNGIGAVGIGIMKQ